MRKFNAQEFIAEHYPNHSTRQLAKIIGVANSTVHRIMEGKVEPDTATIRKMLEPFGYELFYGMGAAED